MGRRATCLKAVCRASHKKSHPQTHFFLGTPPESQGCQCCLRHPSCGAGPPPLPSLCAEPPTAAVFIPRRSASWHLLWRVCLRPRPVGRLRGWEPFSEAAPAPSLLCGCAAPLLRRPVEPGRPSPLADAITGVSRRASDWSQVAGQRRAPAQIADERSPLRGAGRGMCAQRRSVGRAPAGVAVFLASFPSLPV